MAMEPFERWSLHQAVSEWVCILKRVRGLSDKMIQATVEGDVETFDVLTNQYEVHLDALQDALPSETFDKSVQTVVEDAIRVARSRGNEELPLRVALETLLEDVREQEAWMTTTVAKVQQGVSSVTVGA